MSGGFTPGLRRTDVAISGGASFLASEDYTVKRAGITIDHTTVPADADGNKILQEGTFVAEITASGKYGPYGGLTNEVQTLTEGGSGLTSFTITLGGFTTASLDDDATAAQVQAALEALPNLDVGDVEVTGGPLGTGPFTVSFSHGEWAGRDVPAMTTTPTGGTGTVTVATTTAGGAAVSDGRQTPSADTSGYTMEAVNLKDGDVICGLLIRGSVLEARVTPSPDATTKTAVKGRIIYQ